MNRSYTASFDACAASPKNFYARICLTIKFTFSLTSNFLFHQDSP